jgi:hypothetical protein
MDIKKAISLLEKYKRVSELLGLSEDTKLLSELVEELDARGKSGLKAGANSRKNQLPKKNKPGEKEFIKIVSFPENLELEQYDLNDQIISNAGNLVEYWNSLNNEQHEHFTIFELNLILFLISNQYNKYQKKDKKKIISLVSNVVKIKRMDSAYSNIKV